MTEITFIKLGGSLITDKSKPYTTRPKIIESLATQIKKALEDNPKLTLIIGNGAGSFGHFEAAKYNTAQGISNEKQKYGYTVVHNAAAKLNRIVVQALIDHKVAACTLQPSAFITTDNKKLDKLFLDQIKLYLNQQIIPVVYGDGIMGKSKGCVIFSTEKILAEIAKKLKSEKYIVKKVIQVSIVEGVYDKSKKIIPLINTDHLKDLEKMFNATEGFDVTGGMRHKVIESLNLAREGIDTWIISGTDNTTLYSLLTDKKVNGTLITK